MPDSDLSYKVNVEMAITLSVFAFFALWELVAPRRVLTVSKGWRWVVNFGIIIFNTIIVRLTGPAVVMGMGELAHESGWGLLNIINAPFWLAVVLSAVLLDFAIYIQHYVFHLYKPLWRLHMVHHTDLDIDVTTGARFHPVEILLSLVIKIAIVIVIGAPAFGVLIFEIMLNTTSTFNHGNIRLPLIVDRILRWIVVTPDMHRVHHSIHRHETDSNFGFALPWWDRLFGTYRDQPEDGHKGMTIGLKNFRDSNRLTFPKLLILPFTKSQTSD